MKKFVLTAASLAAFLAPAMAQELSPVDRVIGARLTVSEFMRICVHTDANPAAIEDLALRETWIPDAPSSIRSGLARSAESDATVYTFTRSRETSAGSRRTDVQVIVPEPGVRDCTMEFEDADFANVKRALETSGYSDEIDDIAAPVGAPARVVRTRMCQPQKAYRTPQCIDLAVDPAAYPATGQLTLTAPEEGA